MTTDKMKPETLENETTYEYVAAKPTFGQRLKRHCARFWWVHLIIFICVVLVVLLPIFYVGVPHIAQKEVDKATVKLTGQIVTEPETESVNLRLLSDVLSPSKYHPHIEAFEAALYLPSTLPDIVPFTYITIPEMVSEEKVSTVVDMRVPVSNKEQFAEYNKLALNSESFVIGLRGRPKMRLGGLPSFHVDFDKRVVSPGMNGLAGFKVESFEIKLPAEADGANMVGQALIPNPSFLDIFMGNVTLDLFVAGQAIGNTTITDLNIAPGDNRVEIRSIVDQMAVIGMVTSTYKDGMLPVDIVGRSAVANGQTLPYFEAALASNKMHADLNVGAALKKLGVDIEALM